MVPVAADDSDPMQATALERMSFGYGEAEFVPVQVRALGHPDPGVRATAASMLVWNEPVAAEEGLLEAARDPVVEVAVAALETLQYYPTRRVLRTLAELSGSGDREIRDAATASFDDMRELFEKVDERGDESSPVTYRSDPEPRTTLPEAEVLALLDDPDIDCVARDGALRANEWNGYSAAARGRLTTRLVDHPDPNVRDIACSAFAAWSETDALLHLTRDRCFVVQKSAVYCLQDLPASAVVAERIRQVLRTATGTAAQEALRTYIAHASGKQTDRLVELARADPREALRYEAVRVLGDMEEARAVRALAPLLDDPPGVTWSVHIVLLDQLRRLRIAVPPPAWLAAVDNLHLRRAVSGVVG